MGEELLLRLIEVVENAAPKLWGIALKQVQIQIFQNGAMGLLSFIAFIGLCFGISHYNKLCKKESGGFLSDKMDYQMGVMICAAFAIGSFIFFVGAIFELVAMSINPEYYAIEVLSVLVGK